MLVDMFVPAETVGLSGNPLVDFHQGAAVDLPDGRQARVVSLLSMKTSGWVLRCEVPTTRAR